jgi:hypothetical protein
MSLSKEDVLATLKKQGINNLEELAEAATKAKADSTNEENGFFVNIFWW